MNKYSNFLRSPKFFVILCVLSLIFGTVLFEKPPLPKEHTKQLEFKIIK